MPTYTDADKAAFAATVDELRLQITGAASSYTGGVALRGMIFSLYARITGATKSLDAYPVGEFAGGVHDLSKTSAEVVEGLIMGVGG